MNTDDTDRNGKVGVEKGFTAEDAKDAKENGQVNADDRGQEGGSVPKKEDAEGCELRWSDSLVQTHAKMG